MGSERHLIDVLELAHVSKRRVQVAEYFVKGLPPRQIAAKLNVNFQAIVKDMEVIHGEWRKRFGLKFVSWMDQQFARIERMERAAWAGWKNSKKPTIIREDREDPETGQMVTTIRSKTSAGDARFLATALACVKERREIISLHMGLLEKNGGLNPGEKSENRIIEVVINDREEKEEFEGLVDFGKFKEKVNAKNRD